MMLCVGFKRIVLDSVVMSIVIILLIIIAARGPLETIVTLAAVSSFLYYAHCFFQKLNKTVPYFFFWYIISILYVLISYEFIVSSLLLTKSEETLIFLSTISIAFSCLIFTKYLSSQSNQPLVPSMGEHLLPSDYRDAESGTKKCPNSNADSCLLFGMLPFCTCVRRFLCRISGQLKQKYCLWLDCQISSRNFDFYTVGLSLSAFSLFFYTYLILTCACHCKLVVSFVIDIYFPDEYCSDVYEDLYICLLLNSVHSVAICFASGLYALLLAAITSYTLIVDVSSFVLASTSTTNRFNGNHIRPF